MLSYRHAYHAGNHADLLKHLVLMACIEHFNAKDKPYLFVDTHAGAGIYSLFADAAQKTGEYRYGIERIWHAEGLPESLVALRQLVASANGGSKLAVYPGSPWIAQRLCRANDKLRFCELHTTDAALLRREFGNEPKRIAIEAQDGFTVLKASVPPPSRRGLVLIDPSYEVKNDYSKVAAAIKDALSRFATGTYMVWHPLLPSLEANALPDKLKKSGAKHWLHATLSVRAPSNKGHGMHGSGMFVINPPWQLEAMLRDTLPVLAEHLGVDERATWTLDAFEESVKKA